METDLAARATIVLLALYVAGACLCRVNLLHGSTHRRDWIAVYILQAAFAAGAIIDALLLPAEHAVTIISGLLGVAMFLRLSRTSWANGAPAHLERKAPGHGAANAVPPWGRR